MEDVFDLYELTFGKPVPLPFGKSEERVREVVVEYLENGFPIPDDFDWWDFLPPDALA